MKLLKITLPCLILSVVLPLAAVMLFTSKPVEAV
jgi:hypothetical protein